MSIISRLEKPFIDIIKNSSDVLTPLITETKISRKLLKFITAIIKYLLSKKMLFYATNNNLYELGLVSYEFGILNLEFTNDAGAKEYIELICYNWFMSNLYNLYNLYYYNNNDIKFFILFNNYTNKNQSIKLNPLQGDINDILDIEPRYTPLTKANIITILKTIIIEGFTTIFIDIDIDIDIDTEFINNLETSISSIITKYNGKTTTKVYTDEDYSRITLITNEETKTSCLKAGLYEMYNLPDYIDRYNTNLEELLSQLLDSNSENKSLIKLLLHLKAKYIDTNILTEFTINEFINQHLSKLVTIEEYNEIKDKDSCINKPKDASKSIMKKQVKERASKDIYTKINENYKDVLSSIKKAFILYEKTIDKNHYIRTYRIANLLSTFITYSLITLSNADKLFYINRNTLFKLKIKNQVPQYQSVLVFYLVDITSSTKTAEIKIDCYYMLYADSAYSMYANKNNEDFILFNYMNSTNNRSTINIYEQDNLYNIMRELELTKDYLPDIPITTERYDLYSLTKNLIDLSIFSISEVGLINKAIINNDFLNESIKRKIKKKEEEIITRQEDNTTGSRIIIDPAIKDMCSKAGLYEMRKLSYKYTDTFLYDLIEIINDVNLLKLLYYEMEEKGIDYLKNTTVIMYLESNPSLISKEEYNDIIDNEKCKIIGGTKTKYIINNDTKTNRAYIKYNNKKVYFYKKDNNKIFIEIDKKIISITKKIFSYNNKENNYYIKL